MRILRNTIFIVIIAVSSAVAAENPAFSTAKTALLWERYKATFVQSDGRVIDRHQNGISHSESQGYGMLISVILDDRASFDAIWRWTQNNLQGRKDNLTPWSWGKRVNGQWGIIDYNNATDGDVLIAYALVKAAYKWNQPAFRSHGLKIIEGMRSNLFVAYEGRSFLLPAYYGFQKDDALVLNPSYLIFPAYRAFSEIDDKTFWGSIYKDSLYLMGNSAFGTLKLPSDWVVVRKSGVSLWEEKSPLFAYEAIRSILYLSWEKDPVFPEGLNKLFKFYEKNGYLPVSINLEKNQVSLEEAPAGFYAIYSRAAEKLGRHELSRQLKNRALDKAEHEQESYYSMSLLLLALCYNDK